MIKLDKLIIEVSGMNRDGMGKLIWIDGKIRWDLDILLLGFLRGLAGYLSRWDWWLSSWMWGQRVLSLLPLVWTTRSRVDSPTWYY